MNVFETTASRGPRQRQSPFASYRPLQGIYDEAATAAGTFRPHWQGLVSGLEALDAGELQACRDSSTRLMRENGAAFNVYADPDDRAHAWRLHTLPVLMQPEEWRRIEQGLIQRARVLDRVLADLYGPATLLQNGLIPPALVLGSQQFYRTCVGGVPAAGRHLHLYACDIARSADGTWHIIGDQTEAPSGIGYALANRVAMSHGFSEHFRAARVERLAGFFMRLQETLLAAAGRDDGRIVLLGPDVDHPTYFGHAYIARYLGYTLAQTGDLAARDGRLFLKTLDGLQRVDLVIRQIAAASCDPLELPGPGAAGVAGLVRAMRRGNVVIANALGSGLVQNRALAPFMPALARHLLAEDLLLPDAPCLWLGDGGARGEVLDRLDSFRIVETTARNDPGDVQPVIDPASLEADQRHALLARIEREGHRLTAQKPFTLATTPAFDEAGDLVPSPFAMRVYVAATPDGYNVMPGALVRLAGTPETIGLPNGYGAKDCWVVSTEVAPRAVSLLQTALTDIHLRRTGRDLLSRTADNLYWLGRYVERAEGTIRILRSALVRLVEDGRPGGDPALLRRMLDIVAIKGQSKAAAAAALASPPPLERLAGMLMYDPAIAYGLRDSLAQIHRTATLVRDQISHDAWLTLNALHTERAWRRSPERLAIRGALDLLEEGLGRITAFSGTAAENMTRNYAWRFLEMGRRVQRVVHLVDLMDGLVVGTSDIEGSGSLPLLLEVADSSMTYRSRYLARPMLLPTLDLLLLDETNPRAVAFQVAALSSHIDQLPGEAQRLQRTADQRLALRMLTDLRLADIASLAEGETPTEVLVDLLAGLGRNVVDLSEIIGRSYFAHAETTVTSMAARRADAA